MRRGEPLRVAVVVLGDIGRSPRMQYHSAALASSGAVVDLIGFRDTILSPLVRDHPGIRCYPLRTFLATRRRRSRLLFLCIAALRALLQCVQLLYVLLFRIPRPHCILVQTPPAVPTLLIAHLASRCRRAALIVDWHNFGYSMLALTVGADHAVVRAARWYEGKVGRRADAHLCVSRAMQHLLRQWAVAATVLYDRPAEVFAPMPAASRHKLRAHWARHLALPDSREPTVLVVSATSWTVDEDLTMLLDAAAAYDAAMRVGGERHLPQVCVVVTGDGPQRAQYEARARALALHQVYLRTVWLSPEDYPRLLAVADLGVCLHRSSSRVDLPMKIADMFGAGLPVCAFDYGPCLAEQVRDGDNGLLFTSGAELAQQWCELFAADRDDSGLLLRLRRGVAKQPRMTWREGWQAEAWPVLQRAARWKPADAPAAPDSASEASHS